MDYSYNRLDRKIRKKALIYTIVINAIILAGIIAGTSDQLKQKVGDTFNSWIKADSNNQEEVADLNDRKKA